MEEPTVRAAGELRDWILEPRPRGKFEPQAEEPRPTEYEPMPRLRVIGPGRFERGYLQRISGLAAEVEVARDRERRLADGLREASSALEVSQRVEHGCQRRIDRLEDRLEKRTQALLESERAQKRLALALGAMQRDNQLLRHELARISGPAELGSPRAAAAEDAEADASVGWLRRLLRRR